jgi:hypothetical protein
MFPSLDIENILGYPNYFSLRWGNNCPTFYGDPSVTHYFGHSGDVSTVMCSGSHKDFLPEKSDCCLLPHNIFLR